MYCGMELIGINLAAPFLMLGIGIDNTFVMLAAWRRTSSHDPVPVRLANWYREAAVSITITSITDMLSFWIGVITPFPCVKTEDILYVHWGLCDLHLSVAYHLLRGLHVRGWIRSEAEQTHHLLLCCPTQVTSR